MKVEQEQSGDEMVAELRVIRNLLALLVADLHETVPTKARALVAVGMTPKDIAPLIDTTPNTISVALYQSKKATPKRAKAKRR